jgi:hypothetical protein
MPTWFVMMSFIPIKGCGSLALFDSVLLSQIYTQLYN